MKSQNTSNGGAGDSIKSPVVDVFKQATYINDIVRNSTIEEFNGDSKFLTWFTKIEIYLGTIFTDDTISIEFTLRKMISSCSNVIRTLINSTTSYKDFVLVLFKQYNTVTAQRYLLSQCEGIKQEVTEDLIQFRQGCNH